MKIFANHAHTFPTEIKPEADHDSLRRYLDECGIDKCVAFSCFNKLIRNAGLEMDTNRYNYENIKNDNRFVGFGVIDETKDNFEEQIEQIADYGFKGIKVHPQAQDLKIDGEKAFRIYAKCEELGLFISFHSGIHWNRLRDNKVELFDEVAYNFPKLNFSMEHIGGYSYFNEALAVMVNNKRSLPRRIFAGWTTINNSGGAWSISDEQLKILLKQTSDDNSIFGLDFPYNNAEYTIRAIERIKNLDIPEESKEKILGKNLASVLGVEL